MHKVSPTENGGTENVVIINSVDLKTDETSNNGNGLEYSCDLNRLFKFQIIVLRIFGLYYHPNDRFMWKIYSALMVILLWFNSFKFAYTFNFFHSKADTFNIDFVLKLVGFLWLTCCSINATILFSIQRNKAKMSEFCLNYEEIFNKYQENAKKEARLIKIISITITIFSLTAVITNSIFVFASLLGPKTLYSAFSGMTAPFHTYEWARKSIPYKLFCSILTSFALGSWLLPISYYFNYCFIVWRLFNGFNTAFKTFIAENKFKIGNNLISEREIAFEELRKLHLKLCFLVKILNSCFQELIFLTLVIYLPIVLLILYLISDWNGNCIRGFDSILLPFWLTVSFSIIVVIISTASKINTQV
jgi:hypothetical protein